MAPKSPQADTLPTPSMLDDRYRVDALLAVGGMGAIYKGRHTLLRKTVAIKVLKKELWDVPELVERFQREAVAASQIGHEGIVEVTDIATTSEGAPFLVMEYLKGQDLAHCLKEVGTFRPSTAARLCIEILEAIGAAHATGIVHRDLKPENVFVAKRSSGEKLKVLDFGISRMSLGGEQDLRLTNTGLVMGTPYYMSPEQALGDRNVGPLADLYTIGVILYELVTGALPFNATNYNALLHLILEGQFKKPSLLATLSPDFEEIVLKGMAFKQEHRFQSAAEFAEALRPYAEDYPLRLLAHLDLDTDTIDEHGSSPIAAASRPGKRLSTADLEESIAETQLHDSAARLVADGNSATALAPVGISQKVDTLEPQVTPVSTPVASRSRRGPWLALLLLLVVGGASFAFLLGKGSESATETSAARPEPTQDNRPSSTDPAPSTTVVLELAIAPESAALYIDGVLTTGPRVELPSREAPRVVELRLEGYESKSQTIAGDKDQSLALALSPVAPAQGKSEAEPSRRSSKGKRHTAKGQDKTAPAKPASDAAERKKPKNRRFIEDSPYDD